MSPTRRRRRPLRLHWAVALIGLNIVDAPPAYRDRSFCTTLPPPPPPLFARGPIKGGGVACPPSFDSTLSSFLSSSSSSSWALTYYVVAIATSLDAPLSLSLCRRLYRHAATTIAAPTPVSLRLSRASGWLLHRHLSCRASASLVVPVPLSLRRSPLLWRLTCAGWVSLHQLSWHAAISLVTPAGCRIATSLFAP